MKTIELKIEDHFFKEVINTLKKFPKGSVAIIEETDDPEDIALAKMMEAEDTGDFVSEKEIFDILEK